MSKITDVRLENFQSHLDSRFSFTDGLNVLIGQSDSGKTAVIRGIRWALFNQPRGTDFIRAGSDFVRVTVQFDNGNKVIRERTSSKNRYMIEKAGEPQQVFESFGQHVPEEVLQLHGMRALKIDRDHELTIHLAQQLDGPFLLEQPGSMRAKTIGRISGAHFLDAAIRDTSRDLSSLNQSKRWSEEQTENLQQELEPYKDIVTTGQKLQQAYSELEEITTKQTALETLQDKQKTLQTNTESIHEVKRQLQAVAELPKIDQLFQTIQTTTMRLTAFTKLRDQYQSYEQQTERVKQQLESTKEIEQAELTRRKSEELETRRSKLAYLNKQFMKLLQVKAKAENVMEQTTFVQEIDTNWQEDMKQLEQKRQRLSLLSDQYQQLQKQLVEQRTRAQKTIEVEKLSPTIDHIQTNLQTYQQMYSKQKEYTDIKKRIIEGNQFVENKKQEMNTLQSRYEELLKKDGICPTCGQVIQHSHSH
ncbi:AAA family ATPase [Alkalicoccobacillus murimartini]|uniref:Nuclease SbcCD subunit C n=1 Tax=Alkalicoccobacillus murimartini TaxID=171685 RepID=A0ABT9YEI9_9BACI|nr:AAA family ATPase [Alkalicoccobacillus murimartini]MDQ0206271.1 DNA repair exonuclease SbcCD ATPase subunit [Alkalicoccobacillus murimartini]